ncbi:hypothetical protein N44_00740 [Microcystis aeruginosa NIES-44]|uniref:Uncharacterized protein n=1 Tax=Microcystis aeruginosa NIES-44 TaxID=449439 RepID=A0A0A1VQ31_MICAE|nr:hypothetical protein N44_00740 [Microcystis aeruginosa NIES-44]
MNYEVGSGKKKADSCLLPPAFCLLPLAFPNQEVNFARLLT